MTGWSVRIASLGAVGVLALGHTLAPAAPAFADPIPPGPAMGGLRFDPSTCVDMTPVEPQDAWQVQRLGLESPSITATGAGIRIAVIDTGIDAADNPALDGVVSEQYDLAENSQEINCEHGTQVASLIAGNGSTDGSSDFRGVAPDATIIGFRALASAGEDKGQREPLAPTIEAIDEAVAMDVDIINISQQGSDTPAYRAAVNRALTAGIVVVAAAGNQGQDGPPPYPASYPGVIAVGMTDINDVAHTSSQSNPELTVSVAAPGADVIAANPSAGGQSWAAITGTSFAAPLVTGVVALLLEQEPGMTPDEVQQRLEETADPPAGAVPDPQLGFGIVNPARALSALPVPPAVDESGVSQPASAPHPFQRPAVDQRGRNLALLFAGAGVVLVLGGVGTASAVRARR